MSSLQPHRTSTNKSFRIDRFRKQKFSLPLLQKIRESQRECGVQHGSVFLSPCANRIYFFSDLVLSHDIVGTESSTTTLIPYESAFSQEQALTYSKILAQNLKIDFENPKLQEGKTTYSGCLYDLSERGVLTHLCRIEILGDKKNMTRDKNYVTRVVLIYTSP